MNGSALSHIFMIPNAGKEGACYHISFFNDSSEHSLQRNHYIVQRYHSNAKPYFPKD